VLGIDILLVYVWVGETPYPTSDMYITPDMYIHISVIFVCPSLFYSFLYFRLSWSSYLVYLSSSAHNSIQSITQVTMQAPIIQLDDASRRLNNLLTALDRNPISIIITSLPNRISVWSWDFHRTQIISSPSYFQSFGPRIHQRCTCLSHHVYMFWFWFHVCIFYISWESILTIWIDSRHWYHTRLY